MSSSLLFAESRAHYRRERKCSKTSPAEESPAMSALSPKIEFWYEFASTYSYLSVMRIEAAAKAAGVEVLWKPFLLGPIFFAQGWTTSPFNLYPAKGRYMVREMERLTAARGLPFKMPSPFPQNSLLAARIAIVAHDEGWGIPFSKRVYATEFGEGASISDAGSLGGILHDLGQDPARVIALTGQAEIKERLKQRNEEAQELGIFGAPSFLAGSELFWGDDRLEQALSFAKQG
jgi:2-hydroxychromene-2-carboxylate isomerase